MILSMSRVELIGRRACLPAALEFLQARAVLELRAPAAPGISPLEPAGDAASAAQDARLEEALRRIDALARRLPPAGAGPPAPWPAPDTEAFSARLGALEAEVNALEARRGALARELDFTTRFARLVVSLAPLGHGLAPALEPELHVLAVRTDAVALSLLESEVRKITKGACEMKTCALDPESTGVLLVVPRSHGAAIAALLSERGVEEVTLPPAYAGKRLVEVLFLLSARERALPGEIARVDAELAALAASAGASLAAAGRAASWALERRRAIARCGGTRHAFVVCGYAPAERVPALRAEAAASLDEDVFVFDHPPDLAQWTDVPVVLRNRPAVRPFERLLALVPLPRYGSVDPTPWLAVFFPLFFGLVLGDLAFGVLGVAAALVVRRAGWGGATGRDLSAIALWCSLSAILFGLLFGEAFGELGAHLGLRPLLLDRRHGLMTLLALALGVGAIHLGVAMGLGIAASVRARRFREAVARLARLLLLASSAAAAGAAFGALPRGALVPSLVAAAALLAMATLAEGPLALLDLVLGLGNVLSYARLMALGLASAMLAEAANRVADTLRPAAVGLAIAVLLHALNFSLGLVSPAIAALRLHYVEFFEKFYDEGGFPFRPFGVPEPSSTPASAATRSRLPRASGPSGTAGGRRSTPPAPETRS